MPCADDEWVDTTLNSGEGGCIKCDLSLEGCKLCSNAITCLKCLDHVSGVGHIKWWYLNSNCV